MDKEGSAMTRVLIVDDEETFCDYFARYLTIQGFTVEHAYNGFDALTLVQQGEFDAVISDSRMPGIDGPELLRLVKAWCPGARTFLMTAFDIPSGVEADHEGVFEKPFEFEEVVTTLRKAGI